MPKAMELVSRNLNTEHPLEGQGFLDELLRGNKCGERPSGWDRGVLLRVSFCSVALL